MSMQWPSHVEGSLRPLLRGGDVTREAAAAYMRELHKRLLSLEVSELEAAACIARVVENLPPLPAPAFTVRVAFDEALQSVPGLKTHQETEAMAVEQARRLNARWDLKELDNRMRPRREQDWTPSTPLFRRPFMERKPAKLDLSRHKKFRAVDESYVDAPERGIDREKMEKLVRSLSRENYKDFGPEPPTGGSPARI